MRFLGGSLATRGMTVRAIALPGHATRIEDLEPRGWPEWAAAVTAAYDALAARCHRVAVVGQSLGGLLALLLATERPVHAVASLAAPLWFDGLTGRIAHAVTAWPWAGLVRYLPKPGGPDVCHAGERRTNPSYRRIPVRALGQLLALMDRVDAALPAVHAPLLVMHSERDHTAPVACAQRIAQRAQASEVRVRILTESFHLISVDIERSIVAAEVGAFFARHMRS
jgi:carboxylesterase